jgi:Na+/proline symporter
MVTNIIMIALCIWYASLSFVLCWFRPSLAVVDKLLGCNLDIKGYAKIVKKHRLIFSINSMMVFFFGLLFMFIVIMIPNMLFEIMDQYNIYEYPKNLKRTGLFWLFGWLLISFILSVFFRKYKRRKYF